MADNPITGVLSLLRLLKGPPGPGHAVYDHVQRWCGDQADEHDVARVLAFTLGIVSAAETKIRASAWGQEAKDGLLQITGQMRAAFSPIGCGNSVASFFPTLDSSITMFAILSTAAGMQEVGGGPPAVLSDLMSDIAALRRTIEDADLDQPVRDTALRHLSALEMLLRNVDAFGVDTAMAVYFETVVRLRRAEKTASPSTKEKMAKIWPEIERWAGRLAIVDEAVNHGQSLLEHIEKVTKLLPQLPLG